MAISFENELTVQYRARNRSSTLANRNRPLPVKRSSSNWTVTSTPRQNATGPPVRTLPTTRRLLDAEDAVDLVAGLGRVGEVVQLEDLAQGVGLRRRRRATGG